MAQTDWPLARRHVEPGSGLQMIDLSSGHVVDDVAAI
ncbi:hypothetical protein Poly59_38390 [Rubripirellula reticaptiva]|uniref:Uncharacterized protein n=1 Tax=Rubripirellula reticaptiva TaxID=2528013 RepID=A0A5C6EL99_9BACT|nr:hypothetical protein Poly59_38390 [Rubripirellula reticaptiva]